MKSRKITVPRGTFNVREAGNPEYLTGMESCFDQVEVKQFEAGHFVHGEYPEQVGKLINDFLER